MNAESIVIGVAIAVTLIVLAMAWLRRDQDVDLGTVSHHWIAEHRLGPEREVQS